MNVVKKRYATPLQRIQWVCNTIFHQVVAVVTVYIFLVIFSNYDTTNKRLWHIFFCTCAYIPLMAEGIILFSDANVWSRKLERTKAIIIHGILLGISNISVTVGVSFEISRKVQVGSDHFQTDHAIIGLVSWILALVSVALGLLSANSRSLRNFIKPIFLKLIHTFFAISSFGLGITAFSLGLYKRSFTEYVSPNEQLATVVLVGIVAIWSVLTALASVFNKMISILA